MINLHPFPQVSVVHFKGMLEGLGFRVPGEMLKEIDIYSYTYLFIYSKGY